MIRDLLRETAIVIAAAFLAGLVGNIVVGAVATLINEWRDVHERIDQDLADAGTIRASRGEVGDVR